MKDKYGFLLVNKPVGLSSFDVIRKIRKISGIKKIGHSGTLDPFASGLLILCIGKATRLCSFLISDTKEYIAKIKLGIKTDTGDITGKIIEQSKITIPSDKLINDAAKKMLLLKKHIPPKFSAKKINGQRAYLLARQEKEFQIHSTPIKIYSFEVLAMQDDTITYKTKVSKGTYVRTLSEIFASYLNTIATTVDLNRIKIGNVDINQAVELSKIEKDDFVNLIQTPEKILKNYFGYFLNENELLYFKNGREIKVNLKDQDKIMICDKNGLCVGFAKVENGLLKPKIVLV